MDLVLRCGQCGLPWAKVCNGVLLVESRHHGDRHVNAIALEELIREWQVVINVGSAIPQLTTEYGERL